MKSCTGAVDLAMNPSPTQRPANRFLSKSAAGRGGFFLVLVLVILVVATMAVYSFTETMTAADQSVRARNDRVVAGLAVDSAVDFARLYLTTPTQTRLESGGDWDNPTLFRSQLIAPVAGGTPAAFSIVAPAMSPEGMPTGLRYGLQNESAKLNVNALAVLDQNDAAISALAALGAVDLGESDESISLAQSLLLALPGMDTSTADAILDWLDADDEPRPGGCEADFYQSLAVPYQPANGPITGIDQLRLVRGVNDAMLYGIDFDRSGTIDPAEIQRAGIAADDPAAFGWANYLTVHGSESPRAPDGELLVDVNAEDLETLLNDLTDRLGDDALASFIVMYRRTGQSGAAPVTAAVTDTDRENLASLGVDPTAMNTTADDRESRLAEATQWSAEEPLPVEDLSQGGPVQIAQLLDLIDATVTISSPPAGGGGSSGGGSSGGGGGGGGSNGGGSSGGGGSDGGESNSTTYRSPLRTDDPETLATGLRQLMRVATTAPTASLPGRLNLNEASAVLLRGLSVLPPEAIESILQRRAEMDPAELAVTLDHDAWPLTEGLITVDQMRAIAPLVTTGGAVFKAHVIGFLPESSVSIRREVIIDATTPAPVVVSSIDLSALGRGIPAAAL